MAIHLLSSYKTKQKKSIAPDLRKNESNKMDSDVIVDLNKKKSFHSCKAMRRDKF